MTPYIIRELLQQNKVVPEDVQNGVLVWKVLNGTPAQKYIFHLFQFLLLKVQKLFICRCMYSDLRRLNKSLEIYQPLYIKFNWMCIIFAVLTTLEISLTLLNANQNLGYCRSGLEVGDIITHVNGVPVREASDIYVLHSKKSGPVLQMDVIRSGEKKQIAINTSK